jgi:hypothetical protein
MAILIQCTFLYLSFFEVALVELGKSSWSENSVFWERPGTEGNSASAQNIGVLYQVYKVYCTNFILLLVVGYKAFVSLSQPSFI